LLCVFVFDTTGALSVTGLKTMILSVEDVAKSYSTLQGPVEVLSGVSFAMSAGESVALTGESGSGKSTLLHLIAGLDSIDRGQIIVSGIDVGELDETGRADLRRLSLGVIFQQYNLIPSMTVSQNIAFQAKLARRHDPSWDARLLDRLGLADLENRYPEQLSGGQQQRVAIARTLSARPQLVLADEPTGNLDEATGDSVLDLTLELAESTGTAFLLVTHSQRLAERLPRRLHLERGMLTK